VTNDDAVCIRIDLIVAAHNLCSMEGQLGCPRRGSSLGDLPDVVEIDNFKFSLLRGRPSQQLLGYLFLVVDRFGVCRDVIGYWRQRER